MRLQLPQRRRFGEQTMWMKTETESAIMREILEAIRRMEAEARMDSRTGVVMDMAEEEETNNPVGRAR